MKLVLYRDVTECSFEINMNLIHILTKDDKRITLISKGVIKMNKVKNMAIAITLATLVSSTGVLAAEDSNVISNNENIVESTVESVMPQKAVSMRGAVTKADKVYLEQNNTWVVVRINGRNYKLRIAAKENYVGSGYENGALPVWMLQHALNYYGAGLNVDSTFGPKTKAAIKNFQRSHGLSSDGICGPATWRALGGVY